MWAQVQGHMEASLGKLEASMQLTMRKAIRVAAKAKLDTWQVQARAMHLLAASSCKPAALHHDSNHPDPLFFTAAHPMQDLQPWQFIIRHLATAAKDMAVAMNGIRHMPISVPMLDGSCAAVA